MRKLLWKQQIDIRKYILEDIFDFDIDLIKRWI